MTIILKRKKTKVNEDDSATQNQQQNPQNQQNAQEQQNPQEKIDSLKASVDAINKQIVFKRQAISKIEIEISQLKNKAFQLNSQLGENSVKIEDSVNVEYRYSKRLYESVAPDSKVDMLNNLLYTAITRVDRNGEGVSIVPDKKELRTYARNISRFIANSSWESRPEKSDHWEELSSEVKKLLSGRKFKYQNREINDILEKFKELMQQSSMFAWIFGEKD